MASRPVFISHAAANKKLADMLVDLFETGIGIQDGDVFCSSLEGMGIPSGTNFVEFIREQIKEPKIVVLLMTREYFDSQFCLCELGASWILSHNVIPLLVSPLEHKDVKAVLTGIQVLKIDDKNDLNEMQEELVSALGIKGKSFARWEVKRDKFLKEVSEYILSLPASTSISVKEFDELSKNYKEALEEITKSEEDIEKKDALIEKLKLAKDAKEVDEIVTESMDEIQQFETLVKEAKAAKRELPGIVCEALFYNFRNEVMEWPGFGEDYRVEEIHKAIEQDYLQEQEDGVEVVEEDPKVAEAISALQTLRLFINNTSEDFDIWYAENYDHRLLFTSRRFWDTHLF